MIDVKGVMQLYDWEDGLLAECRYEGLAHRKNVMAEWRRRYGGHYKFCYYIITPSANPSQVKFDGLNFRTKSLPEEKPSIIS